MRGEKEACVLCLSLPLTWKKEESVLVISAATFSPSVIYLIQAVSRDIRLKHKLRSKL